MIVVVEKKKMLLLIIIIINLCDDDDERGVPKNEEAWESRVLFRPPPQKKINVKKSRSLSLKECIL